MRTQRKSRHGFTLVELLVVIAIIAILTSILFPVFARAREKANMSSCQSNLKQISMASRMYSMDYDNHFVRNINTWLPNWRNDCNMRTEAINEGTATWVYQLCPYTQNQGVFRCPSSQTVSNTRWREWKGDYVEEMSYAYNYYYLYRWTEEAVRATAETVGFVDSDYYIAAPRQFPNSDSWYLRLYQFLVNASRADCSAFAYTQDSQATNCNNGGMWLTPARHNEGHEIAFVDGHVKYMKSSSFAETPQLWDRL